MNDVNRDDYKSHGHACSDCGRVCGDVSLVVCPHTEAVSGKEVWCWLCNDCYSLRCDEV